MSKCIEFGKILCGNGNIEATLSTNFLLQLPDDILGRWSPSEVEAVAALLSLILTGLIILVYREQVKRKKLERRPIIAAQSYKQYDVDNIAIRLKNYGHGSATRIQVQTIVSPIDARVIDTWRDRLAIWWNNQIPKSASAYPIPKAIPSSDESGNEEESDPSDWEQPYGARIAPSESGQYRIELSLKTNPNILPDTFSRRWQQLRPWFPCTTNQRNPNVKTFGAAFENLQGSSEHYRLRVLVRPQSEFGAAEMETVFDYVIPAERNLTITRALDIGMPYDRFRNNREDYEVQVSE